MYPLFSTTTCNYLSRQTGLGAVPSSAGNPFGYASSSCVTVNSVAYGGISGTTTVTVINQHTATTSVTVQNNLASTTLNFGTTTTQVNVNTANASSTQAQEGIFALGSIFLFFLVVIFWVWMYKIFRR